MRFLLPLLVVLAGPVSGAVRDVPGFPQAREASAASGQPLAVLVHGSAWNRASRLFAEQFWRTKSFRDALAGDFVLCEIDVPQNQDEAATKAFGEATRGWDPKSVTSFPAIQVYGPDGHLLKTVAGRELRGISSTPAAVAGQLDAIGAASLERDRLLREISEMKGRASEVATRIDALNRLGLAPEKDAVKTFAALDPDDLSGWAARLGLGDWEFVRAVTGRIGKGDSAAALADVEAKLGNAAYPAEQRCLILAAKGMLLAALDRKEEAWAAYLEAYRCDPEGANGKAVIRHGFRSVGSGLRLAPSPDSPLFGREMENLTRGRATLTVSAADPRGDKAADHATLFDGPMKDFAFHTRETKGAHIVVDLQAPCRIDAVQIHNRTSLPERAEGLTLWLSDDGRAWRQVWRAGKVEAQWDVALAGDGKASPEARYLKLGLPEDRKGILHLRAVNVFGARGAGSR